MRDQACRTVHVVWTSFAFVVLASCGDEPAAPIAPPPPPPPPPPVDTTPPTPTDTTTTPTVATSDLMFGETSPTSLALSWTNGGGEKRLVLLRADSAVSGMPTDGQTYSADSVLGQGEEVGPGNWAVFAGADSSVVITGLSPQVEYHVAVFEFNGDSTDTKYLTSAPAIANQATVPVPSLIGSWLWGTAGAQLSAVVTFLTDTTYMVVDDGVPDGGGQPGMERGSFAWNDGGVGSGDLTTSPTTDTSGDWGLSPPGPKSLAIGRDSLVVTVEGDVSVAFRVIPSDTNELVGAWLLQDPADPKRTLVLTILDDSNYMLGADDTPGPVSAPGLERGTYSWNAATGAFSSTSATDTNGTLGLNPLIRSGVATVSGDTLTYVSAGGPIALIRVR